jgi:sugar lactone lactonase YvrE
MIMTTRICWLLALAVVFPAPLFAAGGIEFKSATVYPEGIAYNEKTAEFFVSSMRHGTVGVVKADGKYKAFAKDPLLVSSVGLHADPERGRLLVCVSDPGVSEKTSPTTQKKLARLMAFDLKTGKKRNTVELGALADGQHFCNDIAVDGEGNVYVTDSFSPLIYRVDPAFKASIFSKDDRFKAEGFGLNGIVHARGGFLIVGKSDDGSLWRLNEKGPPAPEEVKLSEKLPNADGLVMSDTGDLIVIQNGEIHRVVRVKSTDGWKTANVDKAVVVDASFPTTGVFVGPKLFVNISRLNELFADPKKAKSDTFTLKEVSF